MNDTKSVLADKCDVMFGFVDELTSECIDSLYLCVFCCTDLLLCTLTPTLIMSFDYLRQVVSGKKARYVDRENSVDLDLVYGERRLEPFVQLANHQSPTESSCLSYLAACNAWLTELVWAIQPREWRDCIAIDDRTCSNSSTRDTARNGGYGTCETAPSTMCNNSWQLPAV